MVYIQAKWELTKASGIDIYKQTELTRAGTGRWCRPRILPTWQVHPPSPTPSALPCLKWQLPINNQLSWHAPVAVSKNSTEQLHWQKLHCFIFNTKSNEPGTVFILTSDFFSRYAMRFDQKKPHSIVQILKQVNITNYHRITASSFLSSWGHLENDQDQYQVWTNSRMSCA